MLCRAGRVCQYRVASGDVDELTIGWGDVSIAFRSTDPDQHRKDVVDALSKVVRGFEDQTGKDGSSLYDPHVEIREVILMDEGIATSWGTVPSDLPIVCLLKQQAKHGTGSPIEQRGTNDDSAQNLTSDHDLLVFYSPRNERVVGLGGGRIGDRLIPVVAVDPAPGGLYEGQLRGVRRADRCRRFGDGVEDNGGELGRVLASCSINHCIDGDQ